MHGDGADRTRDDTSVVSNFVPALFDWKETDLVKMWCFVNRVLRDPVAFFPCYSSP